MPRASAILALALSALLGCGGSKSELGEATASAISDTQVLKDAQGAVNDAIRTNIDDCEAVKAAVAEAERKLDEAEPKIRTATGRTTLAAMRTQARNVLKACQ